MGCGSSSGAVAGPIDTLAALATASGASEAELLSLSERDLTELLHEQSVGVLARNRIVEEARRKAEGGGRGATTGGGRRAEGGGRFLSVKSTNERFY